MTTTTVARCTAFDAGTTFCGYAVVEARAGRLYCLEGGHKHMLSDHPADMTWLVSQVKDSMSVPGGFIAAEQIVKVYVHGPGMKVPDEQLLETKDQEGGIVWISRYLGANVVRIPAVEWRGALSIRPPRCDPQVALVVEWLYGPSIRERFTNADARGHAYDALGLAAVALSRRLGAAIRIPGELLLKLEAGRQVAKAASKAKKLAQELVPALSAAVGMLVTADAQALGKLALAVGRLPGDDTVLWALRAIARSKAAAPLRQRAQQVLFAAGLGKDPDARAQSRGQRERAKSKRAG
jgi:hypothetical protein